MHNKTNGIHAQRLKEIRKYVNFDYDLRKPLSNYEKRKIKKYWDEIHALTARPYHVYRPRTADHLKKAQEFAQHEKRLPGLKVAFIPTNGTEKPRIRFTKDGEITATTEHVTTRVVQLDMMQLIEREADYIKVVVAENPDAKSFTVLCGRYEIPVGVSPSRLPAYVGKLTAKYSNVDANNYFGNWLHGLAAHHFKEQASFMEYMAEKQKAKADLQRKRRNKKARARRAK